MNKVTNIRVPPGFELPSSVLNSLWRVIKVVDQRRDHRVGINQNRVGSMSRPRGVDSQFSDKWAILQRGSNLENSLVIIFNLVLWGLWFGPWLLL